MNRDFKAGDKVRFVDTIRVKLRQPRDTVLIVLSCDGAVVVVKDAHGFESRISARWLEHVGEES